MGVHSEAFREVYRVQETLFSRFLSGHAGFDPQKTAFEP